MICICISMFHVLRAYNNIINSATRRIAKCIQSDFTYVKLPLLSPYIIFIAGKHSIGSYKKNKEFASTRIVNFVYNLSQESDH